MMKKSVFKKNIFKIISLYFQLQWLDRVEATINSLRRPEELRPEELQGQLDQLTAEYAQLQEHTATIEAINKEGGKFIRDARVNLKIKYFALNTMLKNL